MDARIINGDCLDVLRTLEPGSVDAVVTDPPYGIKHSAGRTPHCSWYKRQINGDESTHLRDAIVAWAAERDLPWVCFGSWKRPAPKGCRGVLVWDKGPAFGCGDLSFPWKPSWELVYIGGPGWKGKRDEGVLRGPCVISWESRGRVHPHQKPTWLIEALLRKLPKASTILDPFAGSGTTGVACLQTGRRFLGIELSADYCAIAEKRLAEAREQLCCAS